jgi:hypothetical protein
VFLVSRAADERLVGGDRRQIDVVFFFLQEEEGGHSNAPKEAEAHGGGDGEQSEFAKYGLRRPSDTELGYRVRSFKRPLDPTFTSVLLILAS